MTKVDRLLGGIFPVFAGLVLLFFIPMWGSVEISKTYFFVFGVGALTLIFLISKLYDRSLVMPHRNILFLSGAFLLLIFISSLFTKVPWISFFGRSFESSTFGFMFFLVLYFLLGVYYFQSMKETRLYLKTLFLVATPVFILEFVYVLFPVFFSKQSIIPKAGTLFGTWHDMGVVSVLLVGVLLYTLTYKKTARHHTVGLTALLVGSLFFIIVANLTYLYILTLSLILFVGFLMFLRGNTEKVSYGLIAGAFLVVLVSLLGQSNIHTFVQRQGVMYSEIKPSLSATMTVLRQTVKHDTLLGAGPNNFVPQWFMYKPSIINASALWNAPFNAGFSTFLTWVVLYGPFVGLLILGIFVSYVIVGTRTLFYLSRKNTHQEELFYTRLFFALSILLIVLSFINVLGFVALMLLVTSMAIVVAHLHTFGVLKFHTYSLVGSDSLRRKVFVQACVLVLASGILFFGIIAGTKVYAYGLVQKTGTLSAQDNDVAILLLKRAYASDPNDIYARAISQLYFKKVNEISATKITDDNRTLLQNYFKNVFEQSVAAGKTAFTRNPQDLENYFNLFAIYRSVVPVVETAYPEAVSLLDEASLISPNNPTLLLLRAQLEFDNKNIIEAKNYAGRAIQAKTNYGDAYLLLSRIASIENDPKSVRQYVEMAVFYDSRNITALSTYATILLNEKKYQNASEILTQMLIVNPTLHQVRFYLAGVFQALGKTDEALIQLELLKKYLPKNTDIPQAISKVEKGEPLLSSLGSDLQMNTPVSPTNTQ